jgi:hypothetical protein
MVKLVRICFIGVNCKPILSKKKIFLDSRPKVKFDRRINELSKQILTDFTTQHLVEGAFYLPRSGFVQQSHALGQRKATLVPRSAFRCR